MSNAYWSEDAFLRPLFVGDEVWQKILSNFLSHVGDPLQDLPDALQDDIDRLSSMGVLSPTAFAALQFEIEQAGDFGSIVERGKTGTMGQGWSSLADVGLQIADRGIAISGLVDPGLIAALDATRTAQYTVSVPLGKTIGQDGRFAEGGSFTRPVFTLDQRQNSGMTLDYIIGGYKVTTNAGEQYLFDDTGKLEFFITGTGEEITVIYDVNGRISRYENATGDYLEFTYDSNGRIASVEDGNGRVVSYTYDVNGLLTDVADDAGDSEFTYDTEGNLLTAQRVGGPEITFAYDTEGRLASQDVGGISETYSYDNAGAITITNELMEEMVIQIGPGGTLAGAENNLGQSVTITTDVETRTVTITSPDNTQSVLVYDENGRLESATDGNGDAVGFGYDSATGRMISFTDGGGTSREFDYDSAGRLLSATWDDDTSFNFEYDVGGNMIEFLNRRGQSVEYDYDTRGRVTDVSDSASGALAYTYDAQGNVTTITSAAGITEITYDSADRITLIEYPNGRSLAYTYDADGKRLSMVNQDSEGTFYTYTAAGQLETVSDDNGVLTTYAYDAAGRLTLETNANGSYTEYSYDSAGRLDEITNYDSVNAVTSFFQYTFDLVGRKTAAITNDGSWSYDYDDAGQLIAANFTSTTSGIPSKSISYEYDSAGNRIATVEDSVTTNYTSNDLNQYTAAGGKSFTYDDDGNLTAQTQTGNNYTYVYDVDNRLIQVTKPDSTVITYEYDAFGNRSAMVDNGVRTEFLVDPFGYGNVVAEYDGTGTRIASYTHGLGLVSRADSIGDLAFYDMDATGNVVGLTDDGGVLANSYVYTPFGDELYENEIILNSFEFNGAFGVMEDADNLLYMRTRSYDVELGRFLSEDPLFLSGDIGNLYRFAGNDPIQYVDPEGDASLKTSVLTIGKGGFGYGALAALGAKYGLLLIEAQRTDNPYYKKALYQEISKEMIHDYGSLISGPGILLDKVFGSSPADAANNDSNGDGRADGPGGPGGGGGGDGLPPPPVPPRKPERPDDQGSPLCMDLDGDGIELYSVGDYGTYFDLLGTGQAVLTGWVAPDDGILVRDIDASGTIESISELFGSATTDGFSLLAVMDSNADGVVNASDTNFNSLQVWTDINSDGVSQSSELHTLSELGITAINLNAARVSETIAGNQITHTSTFTMNGQERQAVDAWFTYDPLYQRNSEDYAFDIRTAFLPTLKGFGDLKDLHIQASADNDENDPASLVAMLIDLAGTVTLEDAVTDWATVYAEVEALLWRWSGVENVSTTGRGNYVDGRHMAFYEAFMGEPFNQDGRSNPLIEAGKFTEAVYDYLVTFHTMQIIQQIAGESIYENPGYDLYTGAATGDLDLVQAGIDAVEAAAIAAADPAEVWARFAQFIGYTKGLGNLTTAELAALDAAVLATGEPSLDDWQDVVSHMILTLGTIIDGTDDWGSFEVYYDNYTEGTSGDDTITDSNAGGNHNNEFLGLDGNDTIYGLDGHDKLRGGAGNDTLVGGTGDDYMLGGSGDDLYHWEGGNDTISEVSGGGYDELHILSSTGLTTANVTDLYRYTDQLILLLSTGDYITVYKYAETNSALEKIIFDSNASYIDLTAILEQKFYGTAGVDTMTVSGQSFQTLLTYGYASNDTITASGGAGKFYGGDGYDTLIGDYLSDFLYGDNQDDYLSGLGGNDTLQGGSGNDSIYGGDGNDSITGGTGNDIIYGEGGNDTITQSSAAGTSSNIDYVYGGDGTDTITLTNGKDYVWGGIGNDTINAGDGNNFVYGEDGNDDITTGDDADYIEGGAGDDVIYSDQHNDTIYGGDGNDDIRPGSGNDTVYGGEGADYIHQTATSFTYDDVKYIYGEGGADNIAMADGVDHITAGIGNDTVNAGLGNDVYYYNTGDGEDIYEETGGTSDQIRLGAGILQSDLTITRVGDNLLISIAAASPSSITINNHYGDSETVIESIVLNDNTTISLVPVNNFTTGDDLATGTSGADTYYALAGNDVINAGNGNDELHGEDGNDILKGQGGNDTLFGGAGDDTLDGGSGTDAVSYAGVANAVTANLLTGIATGEGTDTLASIETVTGTAYNDVLTGNGSVNTLNGGDGNDTLIGGDGDDILNGGLGDDTYQYSYPDDEDFVSDTGGYDVIQFLSTTTPENLDFFTENHDGGSVADDVKVDFNGTSTQEIVVYNQVSTTLTDRKIEEIRFSDGFSLNFSRYGSSQWVQVGNSTATQDESAAADSRTILGGTNVNTITGSAYADEIHADIGNDTVYGGAGNDALHGGTGTDIVYGGDGNDRLWGGAGADTLRGDAGEDIYYYGSGGGLDTIIESGGIADRIVIQHKLQSEVTLTQVGNNLVIDTDVSGSNKITVTDFYTGGHANAVETIEFSDGSTFNLFSLINIAPDAKNDAFAAGYGVTITGNLFADNGTGVDSDADNDTLVMVGTTATSAQGAAVSLSQNGDFTYIPVVDYVGSDSFSYMVSDGMGGTDTATVTLTISAPSGAIVGTASNNTLTGTSSGEYLFGLAGPDTLNANDGNDTLYGGSGNDTLNGGAGTDTLTGGTGTDTLTGGDGTDTAIWNVNSTGFIIYRDHADYIKIRDTNDGTATGYGTDLVYNDVETVAFNDITFDLTTMTFVNGGEGWGTATTLTGINTTSGTQARDIVYGTTSGNTLGGGYGNDDLYGLAGADTLNGNEGNDLLDGSSGADTLNGGAGTDTLTGGTGTDTLTGGDGTDTAIWNVNSTGFIIYRDHADYIKIRDTNDGTATGYGTDLVYNDVEAVVFNDITFDLTTMTFVNGGEGWGTAATLTGINTFFGTQARDIVYGTTSGNALSGGYGNDDLYGLDSGDTLNGNEGNDLLDGSSGADTLNGGAGTDTLTGGTGTDTLTGGDGTDTAIWNVNSTGFIIYRDHADYIKIRDTNDGTATGYGTDLVYNDVETVAFNDITFDLTTMTFVNGGEGWGTAATLTGINTFFGTQARDIVYGTTSGNTLGGGYGNDDLYGLAGADTLNGNDGNDLLDGGDNNDALNGGSGNDLLYGGGGSDTLTGGDGADTFVFTIDSTFGYVDTISDFSTSSSDALDLSDLISGYDPLNEAITDYIQITTSGSNSSVFVDRDGLAATYGLSQIATITGVTGLTDEAALVTSGHLVVV